MGLTVIVFPWEIGVRGVEVGGPPFLPKDASLLQAVLPGLLCSELTPALLMVVLCELSGGWGFHSGRGQVVVGFELGCVFLVLGVRPGTGGGDVDGAAGED